MKCYRCNCRLSDDRNVCPKCGADVRLYRKIIYASNQYYNLGLTRARARDLTGAAECLKTSLQLYKRNVNARNLLGLVYYEMGEAALALKEWVISKNFRHRGNPADTYIQDMRENRRALDSADHSIHKYNQALEYAHTGAMDLAVIQLKKVISVNPRMLKAYQLLALLYMNGQKYEDAREVIKKCLEIDRGNPNAMSYLKELDKIAPSRPEKSQKVGSAGELEREEVIVPVRVRDYGSYLASAGMIFAGFLLALGVLYYVIMPATKKQYQADNDQEIAEYEDQYVALNATIADLQNQLERAESDKNDISSDYENSVESAQKLQDAYQQLLVTAALYIQSDYLSLLDRFPELDPDASDDSIYQSVYQLMKNDYDNNMTTRLYQLAFVNADQLHDYGTAIEICDKILKIDETYESALYYKALCYQTEGDTDNASVYYVEYLQNFPNGSHVMEARTGLSQVAPAILQLLDTGLVPGLTTTAASTEAIVPGAQVIGQETEAPAARNTEAENENALDQPASN